MDQALNQIIASHAQAMFDDYYYNIDIEVYVMFAQSLTPRSCEIPTVTEACWSKVL